jgi:hypothetical protein
MLPLVPRLIEGSLLGEKSHELEAVPNRDLTQCRGDQQAELGRIHPSSRLIQVVIGWARE